MADLAEMSLASTGVWGAGAAATVRRRVVKYILLVWVRCWLGLQRRRLAVVGRLSWIMDHVLDSNLEQGVQQGLVPFKSVRTMCK